MYIPYVDAKKQHKYVENCDIFIDENKQEKKIIPNKFLVQMHLFYPVTYLYY
jgi:hypothetical protein